MFLLEANRYKVFPLDDRSVERFNADIAGRPTLITGNRQQFFSGMGRLSENSVINVKNKSHAVTASVTAPRRCCHRRGDRRAGRCVRRLGVVRPRRRLAYCYNTFGVQRFKIYAEQPLPAGDHQVRVEFTYDGGGLGKGGDVTLYVDGTKSGEGRVDGTVPMLFSADETTDIGGDTATPVSDDYEPKDSRFNGRIHWVELALGDDAQDADHLIGPEERLRIASTRQ